MADQTDTRLNRFGQGLRAAGTALQFFPHAALVFLLIAILLHATGRESIAETLGDVAFFSAALGVIFRRDQPAELT